MFPLSLYAPTVRDDQQILVRYAHEHPHLVAVDVQVCRHHCHCHRHYHYCLHRQDWISLHPHRLFIYLTPYCPFAVYFYFYACGCGCNPLL